MLKLKTLIFNSCLILSCGLFSYGQGARTLDFTTEKGRMNYTLGNENDAIGSPFIQPFEPVRVKGYDNQMYMARFNAHNNQMVVDLGSDQLIALDNNGDYEVTFTRTNTVYKTFFYQTEDGVAKKGFLAIVSGNDQYSLLREESIKYYSMVPAVTSYQADKPAKYVREADRYYFKKGENIAPLPSKKKDLLRNFPKHSKKIKQFLKENKISLKDENDLIKLSQFLTTL